MTTHRHTGLPMVGDRAPTETAAGASPALVQTVWMRVFMDSLRRAGVSDLVVSPGSRSTPLVFAAEAVGLRCHTVIDERSAGFFALGRAKVTGEPVALLCTSGTAGAHYYPAVIEAAYAFVPLVVITADRPPELQGCAAPQTIDQVKLFGDRVRSFVDLGAPDAAKPRLRALRRKAVQAVALARSPVPGPVHINVPARKPLEPARPESPADIAVVSRGDEVLAESTPRVISAPVRTPEDILEPLADACAASTRGLIVAGPGLPRDLAMRQAAFELARATGFPLLAEASSQLRFTGQPTPSALTLCDGFDILLSSPRFRAGSRPDLILQLGLPPTSQSWASFLDENADCVHCVIAPWGWNDPQNSADLFVCADAADTLQRLATKVSRRSRSMGSDGTTWASRFAEGNELVWRCVDEVMVEAGNPGSSGEVRAMHEGQAMRAVVDALPAGALLSLGNSLPIRTIDTYCRSAQSRGLSVLSQRGANGIDGLISAAAGAASMGDRPVALVLGDVSFVHDLGGLAAARNLRMPLAIVVIDNQGGRIFEQLPIAAAAGELFATHWLTAPGCDLRAAAGLFGHCYARAKHPRDLGEALRQALRTGAGCTIVHAQVEPGSAAADRKRIIAAVDAAVGRQPAGSSNSR